MRAKMMWLVAGLLAVLVLMCLPWAIKLQSPRDGGGYFEFYLWTSYSFGIIFGNPFSFASALLALAALIVALVGVFGKRFHPVVCGILLFASAAAGLAVGFVFGFRWFSILTHLIIASLIGLGLFALFSFRRSG